MKLSLPGIKLQAGPGDRPAIPATQEAEASLEVQDPLGLEARSQLSKSLSQDKKQKQDYGCGRALVWNAYPSLQAGPSVPQRKQMLCQLHFG